MPPVGFETTISAGERPQTYALDRAATGVGTCVYDVIRQKPLVSCSVSFGMDTAVFLRLPFSGPLF